MNSPRWLTKAVWFKTFLGFSLLVAWNVDQIATAHEFWAVLVASSTFLFVAFMAVWPDEGEL